MAFYLAWACLMALPSAEDPCTNAVEVRRFSFESDEDQDYDNQPDDWMRRRGKDFPHYVHAAIDRKVGHHGRQSLRFDLNGAQAVYYSPLIRVDDAHSYIMKGHIRTSGLKNDSAIISISLLDHKRRRIQRLLSRPVTGTHPEWVSVLIGPVHIDPKIGFMVVGCHIAEGADSKSDISGTAWFDDVWVGSLPRLELNTTSRKHYFQSGAGISVESEVLGLVGDLKYEVSMQLEDGLGHVLDKTVSAILPNAIRSPVPQRKPIRWDLPQQPNGFYRVKAMLAHGQVCMLEKELTFAVMSPPETTVPGEFGWSMSSGMGSIRAQELADIAAQAGIHWLKIPLWSIFDKAKAAQSDETSQLVDRLERRGITLVGLLNDPPSEMTAKYAQHWVGVSKIFTMPRDFWYPSLEPVIAGYSFRIRHWQLGGEEDDSFVGLQSLPQTISAVKKEFDRIGHNSRFGYHWNWTQTLPRPEDARHSFLSLSAEPRLTPDELLEQLQSSGKSGIPRWVLLKPLAKTRQLLRLRASDIARQMLAAKLGKAEVIFVSDPLDPAHGLLNADGSPTDVFLPWRTMALTLAGANHIGEIEMPERSRNAVFLRANEAVTIIWNDTPTREEIYLGEQVFITDLWGQRHPVPVDSKTGRQILEVGPTPLIVRGCSESVARWRLAIQFEKGKLKSEYGGHDEALIGLNSFPQGVSGRATLHMPPDWEAEPNHWPLQVAANEKFRLPTILTFPPAAPLGKLRTWIDFDISADRPYKFSVYLPYQLGLGDVEFEVIGRKTTEGRLEIEQIITNNTTPTEMLDFNCSLFIPGQIRQRQIVTKLGKGQDKKFYSVPFTKEMEGKELWLRAEQIEGRRVLNYHLKLGE